MNDNPATSWRDGFSQRLKNWKIHNNSPPFSAEEYREIDAVNRVHNRKIMDTVFRRIEENCPSDEK